MCVGVYTVEREGEGEGKRSGVGMRERVRWLESEQAVRGGKREESSRGRTGRGVGKEEEVVVGGGEEEEGRGGGRGERE
jgi:hypothetical protein